MQKYYDISYKTYIIFIKLFRQIYIYIYIIKKVI